MNRRNLRTRTPLLVLLLALVLAFVPPVTQAQTPLRYFSQTGHYLRGAFRSFWEQNGGTAIFGLPLTEEFTRKSDGKLLQYFERSRFELSVRNNQAFVELGRVGAEVSGIQQTSYNLRGAFLSFYQSRGGGRIFGQPLTNEYNEVFPDGRTRTVQWFERAKFELWGSEVRLTLLGRLLTPAQLLAPWPADTAPGAPLSEDGTPFPPGGGAGQPGGAAGVRLSPGSGGPGQVFTVQGEGFQAGEAVALWVTAPDTQVRPIDQRAYADGSGSITSSAVRFSTGGFANGRWALTAQGVSSGKALVGYFTITGPVGNPGRLGIILQTSLVPQGRANVTPLAAVPGSGFVFTAGGFDPAEGVGAWLTPPNGGALQPIDERSVALDGKGNLRVVVQPQGDTEGVWLVTAQGKNTRRSATASLKLTRDYFAPIGTGRPGNVNGSASPAEGGQRTQFRLTGTGFRANERIEHWVTQPDGSYYLNATAQADSRGRIGYSPGLAVQFSLRNPLGVYGYHWRGTVSGNRVDVYMTFTGAP